MRYIADTDGYVKQVSFGADIACGDQECTEYTGSVPTGYASLEAWFCSEVEKLYRWKIVDGNLALDSAAAAPEEQEPDGSLTYTRVWTNPSPSSAYAKATVELTLEEGDIVDIFYRWTTRTLFERVHVGDSSTLRATGNIANDGAYPREYARIVTVSTTGVSFEDCYGKQTNQTSTLGTQNSYCVPQKIYVLKGAKIAGE